MWGKSQSQKFSKGDYITYAAEWLKDKFTRSDGFTLELLHKLCELNDLSPSHAVLRTTKGHLSQYKVLRKVSSCDAVKEWHETKRTKSAHKMHPN